MLLKSSHLVAEWVICAPTWKRLKSFVINYLKLAERVQVARCPIGPPKSSTTEPRGEGVGGEGGIRTLSTHVESVTYRFHVASIAVNPSDAVGPCSILPDEGANRPPCSVWARFPRCGAAVL